MRATLSVEAEFHTVNANLIFIQCEVVDVDAKTTTPVVVKPLQTSLVSSGVRPQSKYQLW